MRFVSDWQYWGRATVWELFILVGWNIETKKKNVEFQCTWIQSHWKEYTWAMLPWSWLPCRCAGSQMDALCSKKMLTANCRQFYSPTLWQHLNTHHLCSASPWTHWAASKTDSDIMKIPAAALSVSLQPAVILSETVSKLIDVLFCHSYQSTSFANRCAFGWSHYCLSNENGKCWPQRNCMGDKADRPPQLAWKTTESSDRACS